MEQVGYKLVDTNGTVFQQWGGIWGQCPGVPNPITLPNGDIVCGPSINTDYSGYELVVWMMDPPPPAVPASIVRRQASLQFLNEGLVTSQEAIDMARTAAIPAFIQQQIAKMPVADQVTATINFAANQYDRDNSLLNEIMTLAGWSQDQINQFFIAAGGL